MQICGKPQKRLLSVQSPFLGVAISLWDAAFSITFDAVTFVHLALKNSWLINSAKTNWRPTSKFAAPYVEKSSSVSKPVTG